MCKLYGSSARDGRIVESDPGGLCALEDAALRYRGGCRVATLVQGRVTFEGEQGGRAGCVEDAARAQKKPCRVTYMRVAGRLTGRIDGTQAVNVTALCEPEQS